MKFSRIFGVSLIQLHSPGFLHCRRFSGSARGPAMHLVRRWSIHVLRTMEFLCFTIRIILFRCGMFMDRTMLAMHFHELHPDDVEVPKCHLCLQVGGIWMRTYEQYSRIFILSYFTSVKEKREYSEIRDRPSIEPTHWTRIIVKRISENVKLD